MSASMRREMSSGVFASPRNPRICASPVMPGFTKRADLIVRQLTREKRVVFDQVRTRADHAHVALEHVPELRQLVDGILAEQARGRINARVAAGRLPGLCAVADVHGAVLEDFKLPVLQTGARLPVEKRSRRLPPLTPPHQQRRERQHEQDDRQRHRQVDGALDHLVERVFQRFLAQPR